MRTVMVAFIACASIGGLGCITPQEEGSGHSPDAGSGSAPDAAEGSSPDALPDRDEPDAAPSEDGGGPGGFAGDFSPESAPYGGFGGGDCEAENTPVVFVHGNGDHSLRWNEVASTGEPSVYRTLRAAGYNSCELFGINWLSETERTAPPMNYHTAGKADLVADFVGDVKAYTGRDEIDVVAHSMGATVSMHAFERSELWSSVRRYVAISAPLRGLTMCRSVTNTNPAAPVCGSQNYYNSDIFGFYEHSTATWNPRMGSSGFRQAPDENEDVSFYSVRAGENDQILCATAGFVSGCGDSALFEGGDNVAAQLDIGHGSTAADLDVGLDNWTVYNLDGGDLDGVGHYRARDDSGPLVENMLTSSCEGEACCEGYGAPCVE